MGYTVHVYQLSHKGRERPSIITNIEIFASLAGRGTIIQFKEEKKVTLSACLDLSSHLILRDCETVSKLYFN